MRIDVATDYISEALRDAVDEAFVSLVTDYGIAEDEAHRLVDLLDDAEFTVNYGDGEVRPL